MADIRPTIGVPPAETVEFFRSKGYAFQSDWDQLYQEEHGRAFTVTKMMNGSLLEAVRGSLDKVLSQGGTFEQWKAGIVPEMQRAGWYGRVEDREITGVDHPVFIGERRLRTIYDTNLRMARAAGKWKRIQTLKERAPFLMYDAVNDGRTRPLHRLWGGLDTKRPVILPVDHPCWSIYFPPCGWGCRCGVIQLSQRDLDRMGLRVTSDAELTAIGWLASGGEPGGGRRGWRRSDGRIEQVPAGVDPGFAYNPGQDFLRGLAQPMLEGPLARPAISPDPKPPLPPARERPDTVLLHPETPAEEAIDRFLSRFDGPTDGITVVTVDKLGEPLIVDDSFFWRGGNRGDRSTAKLDTGRIEAIELLAEALLDPDEIWWVWEEVATPGGGTRRRLTRRYVARFDIGGKERSYVVVMEIGQGGWTGITAFKNRSERYLDSDQVRGGVLAYRRTPE